MIDGTDPARTTIGQTDGKGTPNGPDAIYGHAAPLYWRHGWTCPIPLPPGRKSPVRVGYTGAGARLVSWPDLQTWCEDFPHGNIALRLLPGVIGIDVDDYGDKVGRTTQLAAETAWGPLPATWSSTSRGPGQHSRIHLYRLPADLDVSRAERVIVETFGEDIQVIRSDHRYIVAWPSIHPDTGAAYRWYAPGGNEADIPDVSALTHLPDAWIAGLTGGAVVVPERVNVAPAVQVDDEFDTPGAGERTYSQAEADATWSTSLAALAATPRGRINAETNNTALWLGHFAPAFWTDLDITRAVIEAQRNAWVAAGGADDGDYTDAHASIRSGLRTAHKATSWRAVPAQAGDEGVDPLAGIAEAEPLADEDGASKRSGIFFTDARFSELVADLLRPTFAFNAQLGWLAWDGKRWHPTEEDEAVEANRRWCLKRWRIAAAKADAAASEDDTPASERKRLAELADGWRTMCSAGKLAATVSLARQQIKVTAEKFDAHPDHLNTPTGIVDLRTGDLHPHDPAGYHTKMTTAAYLGADHVDPRWDAALESIPDDVRDWVQVFMGQAITGYPNTEDRLLLLDGDGQNGKGALTNDGALQAIGDYGVLLNETILVGNVSHPTEKMALRGARLTLIDETPEARRLDTQRLKKVLGQPRMTARELYRKEVTFDLIHTLVVATNYTPTVTESDRGTWRRLLRLRMPYTYKGGNAPLVGPFDRRAIPDLKTAMAHDGDVQAACLTWLVQGAVKWYAAGRQQEVTAARIDADTRVWRGEGDLLMTYAEEHLVLGNPEGAHVVASELLEHFNAWLVTQGNRPWSGRMLASRLSAHEEYRAAGVYNSKRRAGVENPSRPPNRVGLGSQGVPVEYHCWYGIAFRVAY